MRRVDSSLNYRVASFVRVPRLARVLFSTIEETVLNVAHEPIDVYHTEQRVNDVDFPVDTRTAYKNTVAWGSSTYFGKLRPDLVQVLDSRHC